MDALSRDRAFWDKIAEKYAARPVGDVPAFDRKKAFTRSLLTPASVVLEIGCGTGSLALELSDAAAEIHALDVSAEMVRIANAKKRDQGVTNVTFQQGTIEDMVGQAGPFDAIWAYSILHLVSDRPATLQACFQLLKPGGKLISSNVCLGGTWVPYGALIGVLRWLGQAPKVHLYDRPTIVRELSEAGFVAVEEVDVGAAKNVALIVAEKPG